MNFKYKLLIFVIIFVIIVISIFIYNKMINKSKRIILNKIVSAKKNIIIQNNTLNLATTNKGLGWTLSLWIYIEDWTYNYNIDKYIIKWHNCNIWLSKNTNNLNISIPIFNSISRESITYTKLLLQKWNHILVVLDNRNIDLWVNGEMFHSKYLSNVPYLIHNNMKIVPNGGFSGLIKNIVFFSYPIPYISFLNKNNIKKLSNK